MPNDLRDEFIDPASIEWGEAPGFDLKPYQRSIMEKLVGWLDGHVVCPPGCSVLDPNVFMTNMDIWDWPPSPAMLAYMAERPRPAWVGFDLGAIEGTTMTKAWAEDGLHGLRVIDIDPSQWAYDQLLVSEPITETIPAGETFVTEHWWTEAARRKPNLTRAALEMMFEGESSRVLITGKLGTIEGPTLRTSLIPQAMAASAPPTTKDRAKQRQDWLDSIRRKQRGRK